MTLTMGLGRQVIGRRETSGVTCRACVLSHLIAVGSERSGVTSLISHPPISAGREMGRASWALDLRRLVMGGRGKSATTTCPLILSRPMTGRRGMSATKARPLVLRRLTMDRRGTSATTACTQDLSHQAMGKRSTGATTALGLRHLTKEVRGTSVAMILALSHQVMGKRGRRAKTTLRLALSLLERGIEETELSPAPDPWTHRMRTGILTWVPMVNRGGETRLENPSR
jgi:hypothetical protein